MPNVHNVIGESVHHLIAILEDAKKGYLNASEKIQDDILSLLLERSGYERGRYSNELQQTAKQLHLVSPIDQFTLSLLHRTWMDLKTAFKSEKRDVIIHGCIQGEETTIQNYTQTIVQMEPDHELRPILERQLNGIKTVLNIIKEYADKSDKQ